MLSYLQTDLASYGRRIVWGVCVFGSFSLAPFALAQSTPASPAAQPVVAAAPATYVPMTGKERMQKYFKDNYASPGAYFRAFGSGLGAHLGNSPPEWQQGAKGYSRRVGSQFGQFTINNSIRSGLAAAAGYDTRYQRCNSAGGGKRTLHAIKWTFLTRNREGKARFDWARVAGAYASGFIANTWYPDRFGPRDALRIGNQQYGFDFAGSVFEEFLPDWKKLFRRK